MNKIKRFFNIVALWCGLAAIPASGADFSFSYVFSTGETVSGILSGNPFILSPTNTLVLGVSVVSLKFGEDVIDENFFATHFDGTTWTDGGIVSSDGSLNNFRFTTDASGLGASGFYFTFFPSEEIGPITWHEVFSFTPDPTDQAINEWTLTPVGTPSNGVPDSGSSALMLTGAIGGLILLRRKFCRV